MASSYETMFQWIKAMACPECHGSGKCDDADLGDISFNEWTCQECKGKGWMDDKDKSA